MDSITKQEVLNKLQEDLEFILLSHKKYIDTKTLNEKCGEGLNLINTISRFFGLSSKEREEKTNWFIKEINDRKAKYEEHRFTLNPVEYILDILQKEFLFDYLQFKSSLKDNCINLEYKSKTYKVKVEEEK